MNDLPPNWVRSQSRYASPQVPELTPEEKLAAAGLTADDLRAVLGLA